TGPKSRQISHDLGQINCQISHDSVAVNRPTPHDCGTDRLIIHDSIPTSRPMSHDSIPTSRPMSHDSIPTSRPMSHDSILTSRPMSHDSIPTSRPMSHDSIPTNRPMSHDSVPTSRPMSHDSIPTSRPMSHDSIPTSRPMSQDTVPMNHHVSCEIGSLTHQYYYEIPPLTRHMSHEPSPPVSPALLQRHCSIPPVLQSPVFRPRPVSSPATTHSLKALQVLGETACVVNSSQFYPGRLVSTCFGTSFSSACTLGGRPFSRTSSREHPVPPVPTHRPRTPMSMGHHAVHHPGRPLSLAMSSTSPCPDITSPASVTSEASSRAGRRRRGPGLLVGRTSWLSRTSSARKSNRQARRPKKPLQLQRQQELQNEELDERVPGRAGRVLIPQDYQQEDHSSAPQTNSVVFVPPQRRQSSGTIKLHQTLLRRLEVPEIRTAHAHLLMPLNQPVGSHMVNGRSQKAAQLVRSMLEDEEQVGDEVVNDTASEPGGAKFTVKPGKKPRSEPSTARLNLRATKNPELILRALGVIAKLGRSRQEQPVNEAANERVITQLLLQDLAQRKSGQGSRVGSAESLVESIVSSRGSNGATKRVRRVRRKKSQKRQPALPAYPSWKRAPRLRSPRGNGDITQKGYEKKKARLLQPYVIRDPNQGGLAEAASPSTRSRRRAQRRVTRNESRYHSEVRQEAVKEALAQYQSRPKNLPLPSKRSSVMTSVMSSRSPDRHHRDSG
ncbi:hypothetical protein OTU49_012115, partial [Cherax quadricarinatus]